MPGRIFAESTSLAQDKAKILFDYYRKAAEKIVAEETDLEKKVAVCQEELAAQSEKDKKQLVRNAAIGAGGLAIAVLALVWKAGVLLALGGLALVAGLVLLLVQKKQGEKAAAAISEKIGAFQEAHKAIRRDYKVSKLGVAYVPVASQIPFEGRSFFIDHTGAVPGMSFTLSALRAPAELNASIKAIQALSQAVPVVESAEAVESVNTSEYSTSIQSVPMYDYLGNLDRQIRNVSYLLKDVDRLSVSLPIIAPNSPELAFIDGHATFDEDAKPVVPVFETDASDGMIKTFNDLNEMKKGREGRAGSNDGFFKELMGEVARDAQAIVRSKLDSTNKLLEYGNRIFASVLKCSFNHYSPSLEAEEIERIRSSSFDYQDEIDDYKPFALKPSSRVRYDLASGNWVAEDGSRTSMPFGIHQVQEEILSPLIQNLMAETRIERLKIYNQIKDQKLDYLNQWHKETNDFYGRNRAEANDLINRMREALSEYMAAFNTYKALQKTDDQMSRDGSLDSAKVNAEGSSAEALAAFELQANEFRKQQEDFVAFMERIKEDIDLRAAEFGHIEFYEASLRDDETRKIARSMDSVQALEPRRKQLLSAGPHFAAFATVPPAPRMEGKLYDDLSIDLVQEAERLLAELQREAERAEEAAEEEAPEGEAADGEAEPREAEEESQDAEGESEDDEEDPEEGEEDCENDEEDSEDDEEESEDDEEESEDDEEESEDDDWSDGEEESDDDESGKR